ncbi:MAG: hypothetical protein QXI12_01495 [Candidatus Methanomethyliaceae archaeon]
MDVETAIRLVERKLEMLEALSNMPPRYSIWGVLSSLIYLLNLNRLDGDERWDPRKTTAETAEVRAERKRRVLEELEQWPFDHDNWRMIASLVHLSNLTEGRQNLNGEGRAGEGE